MDKKERMTKELMIMIQPSLYEKFKETCETNYSQMSEVIRQMIYEYIKRNK